MAIQEFTTPTPSSTWLSLHRRHRYRELHNQQQPHYLHDLHYHWWLLSTPYSFLAASHLSPVLFTMRRYNTMLHSGTRRSRQATLAPPTHLKWSDLTWHELHPTSTWISTYPPTPLCSNQSECDSDDPCTEAGEDTTWDRDAHPSWGCIAPRIQKLYGLWSMERMERMERDEVEVIREKEKEKEKAKCFNATIIPY